MHKSGQTACHQLIQCWLGQHPLAFQHYSSALWPCSGIPLCDNIYFHCTVLNRAFHKATNFCLQNAQSQKELIKNTFACKSQKRPVTILKFLKAQGNIFQLFYPTIIPLDHNVDFKPNLPGHLYSLKLYPILNP